MPKKIALTGLPDPCVTPGLRKAAAPRLAKAGCTTLQIMAVTGHKSPQAAERYTWKGGLAALCSGGNPQAYETNWEPRISYFVMGISRKDQRIQVAAGAPDRSAMMQQSQSVTIPNSKRPFHCASRKFFANPKSDRWRDSGPWCKTRRAGNEQTNDTGGLNEALAASGGGSVLEETPLMALSLGSHGVCDGQMHACKPWAPYCKSNGVLAWRQR